MSDQTRKDDAPEPAKPDHDSADPLRRRGEEGGVTKKPTSNPHIYRGHVCITDSRGYPTHRNRSPFDIRVDASDGFIPLWAADVTLRWRFQERGIRQFFADPDAAKVRIKLLFGEALDAWGDAAPVKFNQTDNNTDFEIVMLTADDCDDSGCVLAAAFFPDGGRHELTLYPKFFEQSAKEQKDTLIHEIGHIFGLRHFFANTHETAWPSRLFGTDDPFSIMNYGDDSELTETDKSDLKRLYVAARSGELREIDRAPIRLVKPYSALLDAPGTLVAPPPDSISIAAASVRTQPQILLSGRKITIE